MSPKGSRFKAKPEADVHITFTAWTCTFATNCMYCSHYAKGRCSDRQLKLLKSLAQAQDQVLVCDYFHPRGQPRRKALIRLGI